MRRSLVTLPLATGTLKSTRIRTVFPETLISATVLVAMSTSFSAQGFACGFGESEEWYALGGQFARPRGDRGMGAIDGIAFPLAGREGWRRGPL